MKRKIHPYDNNKRLSLQNDFVFKKIFSKPENNYALKELVEAILGTQVKKIEVKNPEMPKNYLKEKLGVLDIKAYVNDDIIVDIEMQAKNVTNIIERDIAYNSKIYVEQLHVRDDYLSARNVISINILGQNLLKRNAYRSTAYMSFVETKPKEIVNMGYKKEQRVLTHKMVVHYIELKKFKKKNPGIETALEQWLWLIIGKEDKINMIVKKNNTIKKVVEELDEMSLNEQERWEAFQREYAIREYNIAYNKGEIKERRKIAKKMKKEGADIEFIVRVTGLDNKQVEAL